MRDFVAKKTFKGNVAAKKVAAALIAALLYSFCQ
jgi:hypothetical protein